MKHWTWAISYLPCVSAITKVQALIWSTVFVTETAPSQSATAAERRLMILSGWSHRGSGWPWERKRKASWDTTTALKKLESYWSQRWWLSPPPYGSLSFLSSSLDAQISLDSLYSPTVLVQPGRTDHDVCQSYSDRDTVQHWEGQPGDKALLQWEHAASTQCSPCAFTVPSSTTTSAALEHSLPADVPWPGLAWPSPACAWAATASGQQCRDVEPKSTFWLWRKNKNIPDIPLGH